MKVQFCYSGTNGVKSIFREKYIVRHIMEARHHVFSC